MKFLFSTYIVYFFSLYCSFGQEFTLKLKSESNPAQTRTYYFKQVIDSRIEKTLGIVYDSERNKLPATFEEDFSEQTKLFYNSQIIASTRISHNFQIKVYNIDLKEIYQADRRNYKGEIQLSVGFFLLGENEPVHMIDFNGKIEYRRPASQVGYVEISVQRLFENSWKYFDAWFSSQSQTNIDLAKKVKLNIIDSKRESTRDTVFYDPGRPLTWNDFRDLPSPTSSFNASIFTSLSIEGNAQIVAGEIIQTVDVKVYMIPSQSWVKRPDDYGNNHEQRHFDLTRIAADRMIYKLKNTNLEPNLFQATLNDIYLDAYREMNKLQEVYDKQTRHGINKESQAKWNQMIKESLSGNWEKLDQIMETNN